ncbi:vWA domain-containing protein [Ectopseudomonas composti]|nr:vWA domain-containing protein [Pseudomonas composti]
MGAAAPLMAADKPLLQEGKKALYQRVLTTPTCQLGDSAGASAGKAQPAFTRFYVYQREQAGNAEWLRVGPDSYGKTVGWINGDCAVPWKMQMTLALTNPAGRDPLLFFRNKDSLEQLFAKDDPAPLLKPILANMKAKGRDPAVVAREPDYAVDLAQNFYLLPVLEAEETFTEKGFQVRLLNVASVSAAESADKKDADKTANADANTLKGFSAAVVFVIDSTISMGPYIDRTREAVKRIYDHVEQEKLLDQVKFGLVAYRSSTKEVPKLEYVSKMYVDPSTVKDGKDFLAKVAELKPATASSSSYDEDTYAGVMQALDQVKWNEFGARYIVLVTDAGAVDGDSKLSSTGLNADQVRLEAKYRGVAIYSLHLKTPSGSKNHASAEVQYTDLSTNAFLNKPLYYPVDAGNVESFGKMVDSLGDAITAQVKAAYRGDMAAGSALGADAEYAKAKSGKGGDAALAEDAELLGHAMRLAYLGEKTGASAPPVFQAWISDRDFVRQDVPTTDVRVLMTKSQLSDLSDVVKQIADAANEGLISPSDMFERLRSVAATMGKDPNQLKDKTIKVADMGLMAEYLDGLPYLSDVLSLDEETWKGMEGLEQEKFIRRLNTKLKYYQRYNSDADRWVSLAPGSDPREHVYPVPLEALP